ncbi:MAG: DUF1127 domain-containing protein [Pseudomonadota bacterium]
MQGFTQSLRQWRVQRNTHHALSRLTERELKDIGFTRGDIASVARNAAHISG